MMGALLKLQSTWRNPFQKRSQLAIEENDNTFLVGSRAFGENPLDRPVYDRRAVLEECLNAWRFNPLARRLVELTSQYAAGGGMTWRCDDAYTNNFLRGFWNERLNRLD